MTLAKAKLYDVEHISSENHENHIPFMFNPTELEFSRTMDWDSGSGASTDDGDPLTSFKRPNPVTLKINNIILDTYEQQESVIPHLRKFMQAVEFMKSGDEKGKRPPIYLFTWGNNAYLRCYVSTLTFKLTLFLPDGTPVRAVIPTLELTQGDVATPKGSQLPPSVSSSTRLLFSR
jgi:Contractile injection system tube protein